MTDDGVDAHESTPTSTDPPGVDRPLPVPDADVTAKLAEYRQGDVLPDFAELPVVGDARNGNYPTPNGVVIVSQTCDVVQPTRVGVAVAPLVRIPDPKATEARNGKWPSLAPVPEIGADAFVDLEVIGTIAKVVVARSRRLPGLRDPQDMRRFGQAVGRKYARWPFPDEIVPWLKPLETVLVSKAGKETSSLGRILEGVLEIRVEAFPDWITSPPLELTLHLIVKAGVLPMFVDDNVPDLPDDIANWFFNADNHPRRSPSEVADRLESSSNATERFWLWQLLAQACAARCHPRVREGTPVAQAVSSVTAEVVAEDEYTYDRVRRTVQLDLDHLSPPLPS